MTCDCADRAYEELRALRRAEHHFYSHRADLIAELVRLTARVEELEARQRRRDSAAERLWGKPEGETA